jgi:ketosteroid isomerase-like protein
MKTFCLSLALAVFLLLLPAEILAGHKSADLKVAQNEVNELMDKYASSLKSKNAGALSELLTDDGQFYGTDPTEMFCKLALLDTWTQMFADKSTDLTYSPLKREIKVFPGGRTAIIVEQFSLLGVTPRIPWRMVSHAQKVGNSWKLDFISWNLTPRNEDIGKLNKALE